MSAASPMRKGTKDELGGKPMTFWEHLDELRRRLISSVLAFLGGA